VGRGEAEGRAAGPTRRSAAALPTGFPDLEMITADWVDWYNEHRLMHRLGRIRRSRPRSTTTRKPVTVDRLHT